MSPLVPGRIKRPVRRALWRRHRSSLLYRIASLVDLRGSGLHVAFTRIFFFGATCSLVVPRDHLPMLFVAWSFLVVARRALDLQMFFSIAENSPLYALLWHPLGAAEYARLCWWRLLRKSSFYLFDCLIALLLLAGIERVGESLLPILCASVLLWLVSLSLGILLRFALPAGRWNTTVGVAAALAGVALLLGFFVPSSLAWLHPAGSFIHALAPESDAGYVPAFLFAAACCLGLGLVMRIHRAATFWDTASMENRIDPSVEELLPDSEEWLDAMETSMAEFDAEERVEVKHALKPDLEAAFATVWAANDPLLYAVGAEPPTLSRSLAWYLLFVLPGLLGLGLLFTVIHIPSPAWFALAPAAYIYLQMCLHHDESDVEELIPLFFNHPYSLVQIIHLQLIRNRYRMLGAIIVAALLSLGIRFGPASVQGPMHFVLCLHLAVLAMLPLGVLPIKHLRLNLTLQSVCHVLLIVLLAMSMTAGCLTLVVSVMVYPAQILPQLPPLVIIGLSSIGLHLLARSMYRFGGIDVTPG